MDLLISAKDYFLAAYFNRAFSPSFPYTFLLNIICTIVLLKDIHIARNNWLHESLKLLFEIIISCICTVFLQCILLATLDSTIYANNIVILLFIAFYAIFRSNYSAHNRITMSAIFYSTVWAVWRLINGIFLTNQVLLPNGSRTIRDLFSMGRVTIATVGVVFFLKYYTERKSKKVPMIYWLLILFISSASILTFIMIDYYLELSKYPNIGTYIAVIFIVINLLTYYMYNVMTTEHLNNIELKILNQKSADETLTMEKNEQLYQNIRTLRHEMKNHISFMQNLLANKEYETLDNYFHQLYNEDFASIQTIDCGNSVVNTIINNEMVIAQTKGIHFETFIGIPPTLSIKDKDMCSILSNILDNAFEAAFNSQIPVVDLTIKIVNDFLFIKCKNSMSENIFLSNPKLKTTKSNSREHGLGIKVIKKIASSYNGQAIFEEKDGLFVVTAMLLLPDKEQ